MAKKAEDIRRLDEIIEELFKPVKGGSALERCAKVRHTLYEIRVWRDASNMPISEIPAFAKNYFCERFLKKPLSKASKKEIADAIIKLGHAENSCIKRCSNLAREFNTAVNIYNSSHVGYLEEIHCVESFVDFYTFAYDVRTDCEGNPVLEKPYNFEIRVFYDKENRSDTWYILKHMLEDGRVASIQNVTRLSRLMYANSVKI